MSESPDLARALERLDEVTRTLRIECPWDREQDERSIVPHTIEEAYELAEAARTGDDEAIRDELGDVLFQVVFLSLLLEERGEGDLAGVATQLTEKLIRRHPHVYPPAETGDHPLEGTGDRPPEGTGDHPPEGTGDHPPEGTGDPGGVDTGTGSTDRTGADPGPGAGPPIETAGDVRRQWDRIKRDQEGRTSESDWRKPGLPALVYANKVQWKLDPAERPANAGAANPGRAADEARIGEALWETVAEARRAGIDPELALRAIAERRAPGASRTADGAPGGRDAGRDPDPGEPQ